MFNSCSLKIPQQILPEGFSSMAEASARVNCIVACAITILSKEVASLIGSLIAEYEKSDHIISIVDQKEVIRQGKEGKTVNISQDGRYSFDFDITIPKLLNLRLSDQESFITLSTSSVFEPDSIPEDATCESDSEGELTYLAVSLKTPTCNVTKKTLLKIYGFFFDIIKHHGLYSPKTRPPHKADIEQEPKWAPAIQELLLP